MSIKLRKRKLNSGKLSLYLDIYQNGHRHYEYLYLVDPKDKAACKEAVQLAESVKGKRQVELQNETYGFTPKFKRQADFISFCQTLADEKSKDETAWHNTVRHLRQFSKGHIAFGAINETWLEQFKGYLEKHLSPNTAHTYFSKVKAALRQALKQGIISTNPAERVSQIRKTESRREYLTLDELQRLSLATCRNETVKRAFLFSCFCGLRLSDVEALTWANVKQERLEFVQKKTGGVEYMPLSPQALFFLKEMWLAGSTAGDNGKDGHFPELTAKVFPLPSRSEITNNLNQLTTSAGIIKRVSFHTSRHSFATLSLTYGNDLYTVSKLLGHKSIQATQIYAKIIDQKKLDAVNRLPMLTTSGKLERGIVAELLESQPN